MTLHSTLRLCASAFALGTALAMTNAAHAGVERVNSARNPDENCDRRGLTPSLLGFWYESNRRPMRIAGTGPDELEFYGHLLDLAPSAAIEGVRGARVRRTGGHSGVVNAARFCGAVGSLVVELNLPNVTRETNGTLLMGLERFPIVVVPYLMGRSTWHDANIDARAEINSLPQPRDRTAPRPTHTGPISAPTSRIILIKQPDRPCSGDGCPPSGGSGIRVPRDPFADNFSSEPERNPVIISTVNQCLDAFGGTGVVDGTRLTVTFPRERSAPVHDCFDRYFAVHASAMPELPDVYLKNGGQIDPAYTVNNLSNGPRLAMGTHPQVDYLHVLQLGRRAAETLVGEYRYTVSVGPAANLNQLELILKSDPLYGVANVAAAASRTTEDAGLTVRPHHPVRAGQQFYWSIKSTTRGLADRCFSVTEGTISPTAGATTFALPTNADPTNTCRQAFQVTVKPAEFKDDAYFDDNLFGKTLTFTPGVYTGRVVQPTSPVAPVTPRAPISVPPRT